GYSSLAYLHQLPVQTLKIDRSFILGIGGGQDGEAIVRSILSLAANLALDTVAEGVETAEQADFLRKAGCSAIQGFFYGRPLPAMDFSARWRDAALS
ncbi:hypothetical protein C3L29_041000, partial [Pseudomonas sp. MWU12-2534b]